MVSGYKWRTEQRNILIARFVAPAINACAVNLKRPITMEALLEDGSDQKQLAEERKQQNRQKSGNQLKQELTGLLHELDGEVR